MQNPFNAENAGLTAEVAMVAKIFIDILSTALTFSI
jgi:hypothetical protein